MPVFVIHTSVQLLWLNSFSSSWIAFHRNYGPVARHNESVSMTYLCQEVAQVYWMQHRGQYLHQQWRKGGNNVALHCRVSQQGDGRTSLNSKLICPHRLRCGPAGWEERASDCVLFFHPAWQTAALTKCPFCAVSFQSDWTNWDLLTANPIRAGTGQSRLSICHPWHTELPLPLLKTFVSVTLPAFPIFFFLIWELESPKTGREMFSSAKFNAKRTCWAQTDF